MDDKGIKDKNADGSAVSGDAQTRVAGEGAPGRRRAVLGVPVAESGGGAQEIGDTGVMIDESDTSGSADDFVWDENGIDDPIERPGDKINWDEYLADYDEEPVAMFSEPPKVILDISDKGVFDGVEVTAAEDYDYLPAPEVHPRDEQNIVGVITGTFDVLHQGHIYLIRQAKKRCDKLVIGIETDNRVRAAKGKRRPIFHAAQRKKRLERALADGTVVEVLPETFGDEQIRRAWLRDHHAKLLFTTKYDQHLKNKQLAMLNVGGRVEFLNNYASISTTQILEGRRPPRYLVYDSDIPIVERFRQKNHGQS